MIIRSESVRSTDNQEHITKSTCNYSYSYNNWGDCQKPVYYPPKESLCRKASEDLSSYLTAVGVRKDQ
jgi:hypothetical protein